MSNIKMAESIAVFEAGATVSSWISLDGNEVRLIIVPAGFTTADLGFEIAVNLGATPYPIFDLNGSRLIISAGVQGGRVYRVPIDTIGGFRSIRFISSVAQTARREISVRHRAFE